MSYLKTKDGAELDLIVDTPDQPLKIFGIKSKDSISEIDLRYLMLFEKAFKDAEFYCILKDSHPKKFGNIRAIPW